MYKCVNNLNPTYLRDLFVHKNVDYELSDPHKLEQPKFNTKTYGYRSFMFYGSKLWNLLPSDFKRSTSIYEFRGKVTEWCFTVSPNDFVIFQTHHFRLFMKCFWCSLSNMVSIFYDIILLIESQMHMCNPVLGSMHLPLLLCVDIYTLCHSREILKWCKLKNFVCNIWCLCQCELLSEYLIMYILYSCIYIACLVYVYIFYCMSLVFTVLSDNSSMELMLFVELNRL